MLFVVIGSSTGKTREEIMKIYPRHKAFTDKLAAQGVVVGIGPFTDEEGGNMGIFRTREAAETFAKLDPFLLEGVAKDYRIKEWADSILS